jgi:hypothetical protein
VRENSRIAKTKIVPEPLPEGNRKGRNTGSQNDCRFGRPMEQNSSCSSSSETGFSKQSSSDDSLDQKETKDSYVDLEKLMKTSSYIFIDSHHLLSQYELKCIEKTQHLDKENNKNLCNKQIEAASQQQKPLQMRDPREPLREITEK